MVSVIGLGFVGLTTALGMAEYGHRVYGLDASSDKMARIAVGEIPFEEPGLDQALSCHLDKDFIPTDDWKMAINDSECVFVCVGTPCDDKGASDLSQVKSAIKKIIESIEDDKYHLIVIKSTIPPCTSKEIINPYMCELAENTDKAINISLANNPEFLREGHCWDDFINADRIVIGTEDSKSEQVLRKLYSTSGRPIYAVNLNTAEYIKYLSNTALATLISFANEMSLAADAFGDIKLAEAFRILQLDKRWQDGSIRSYIYPGCGFGGYCLPKDSKAFYHAVDGRGYSPEILGKVIELNEQMPAKTAERIAAIVGEDKSKCIGILGLAFNAGSDDVRNAVSVKLIEQLQELGYRKIVAYDPQAMDNFKRTYNMDIEYAKAEEQLIERTDAIAILVRWPQFMGLRERTDKLIIDCVNML